MGGFRFNLSGRDLLLHYLNSARAGGFWKGVSLGWGEIQQGYLTDREPTAPLCSGAAEIPLEPLSELKPSLVSGFAVSAVTKHFSSREDVPAWGWHSAEIQICKTWLNNALVPEHRAARAILEGRHAHPLILSTPLALGFAAFLVFGRVFEAEWVQLSVRLIHQCFPLNAVWCVVEWFKSCLKHLKA